MTVSSPIINGFCRACGYNLKGLSLDGRCPECGVEIKTHIVHSPRSGMHGSPIWSGPGDLLVIAAAATCGLLIASIITQIDGEIEHFDSQLYYVVGLPGLGILAAIIGYL